RAGFVESATLRGAVAAFALGLVVRRTVLRPVIAVCTCGLERKLRIDEEPLRQHPGVPPLDPAVPRRDGDSADSYADEVRRRQPADSPAENHLLPDVLDARVFG